MENLRVFQIGDLRAFQEASQRFFLRLDALLRLPHGEESGDFFRHARKLRLDGGEAHAVSLLHARQKVVADGGEARTGALLDRLFERGGVVQDIAAVVARARAFLLVLLQDVVCGQSREALGEGGGRLALDVAVAREILQIRRDVPIDLQTHLLGKRLPQAFAPRGALRRRLLAASEEADLEVGRTGFEVEPRKFAHLVGHHVGVGEDLLDSRVEGGASVLAQTLRFLLQGTAARPERVALRQGQRLKHGEGGGKVLFFRLFLAHHGVGRDLLQGACDGFFERRRTVFQRIAQEGLHRLEFVVFVRLVLHRGEEDRLRLHAPGGERISDARREGSEGQLLLTVLVDLVDDERDALSRFRQRLREEEAFLRLHMVVVHDVEDEVGEVDRLLRRQTVRGVGRVDARRVHEHDACRERRRRRRDLDALDRCAIAAERLHEVVVVGREVAARLSLSETRFGILLAVPHIDEVRTRRYGTRRQQHRAEEAVDHARLARREMAAESDAEFAAHELFGKLAHLALARGIPFACKIIAEPQQVALQDDVVLSHTSSPGKNCSCRNASPHLFSLFLSYHEWRIKNRTAAKTRFLRKSCPA